MISNTSSATISANISVDGTTPSQTSPYQVTLAPWETRVLDILSDLVGNGSGTVHTAGGISIDHNGQPGQILARMYTARPNVGYSATAPFVDPETTASQRWHGSGLRFRNLDGTPLRTGIALRNVGTQLSRVNGKIIYTKPNGDLATIVLPERQIGAGAAKVFDLSTLIDNANVPAAVKAGGIEIEYDTPKGTITSSVQSGSVNGEHVFQVPMFDPLKLPSSAGGFPWKADGDYSTVVYIKNETDQGRKYTAHLIYSGGQYSLGVRDLRPGETTAIDFREIRDEQTPDTIGRTIPLEIDRGQIAWSVKGGQNKSLSGRSEQISLSGGTASTYACYNCCPDSVYQRELLPSYIELEYGSNGFLGPAQTDMNCYYSPVGPYVPSGVYWFSDNTNVISLFDGELVSGDVGTANISATWDTCLWWVADGNCDPVCDQTTENSTAEVKPKVEINVPSSANDGSTVTFSSTTSPGPTPTSYQWSFTPTSGGNDPNLSLTSATSANTNANAKWYANPNNACTASTSSNYTVKLRTTWTNHSPIEKTKTFAVEVPWTIAGKVEATPTITGTPTRAQNGSGIWEVTGFGSLAYASGAVKTMYVPQASQFYTKTNTHEEFHITQWNSITGIFANNYNITALYNFHLASLTDTTEVGLMVKINVAIANFLDAANNTSAAECNASEIEAYNDSDIIAPQYLYQRCNRTTFTNC